MICPIFRGSVRLGILKLADRNSFSVYLAKLEGKEVQVVVREPKSQRSLQQNRYYHGVVVAILSEHTGNSKLEMHNILRGLFLLDYIVFNGNEIPIVKSTTDLNTKEFEEYLSEIRGWASQEDGIKCFIPEPNEVEL